MTTPPPKLDLNESYMYTAPCRKKCIEKPLGLVWSLKCERVVFELTVTTRLVFIWRNVKDSCLFSCLAPFCLFGQIDSLSFTQKCANKHCQRESEKKKRRRIQIIVFSFSNAILCVVSQMHKHVITVSSNKCQTFISKTEQNEQFGFFTSIASIFTLSLYLY